MVQLHFNIFCSIFSHYRISCYWFDFERPLRIRRKKKKEKTIQPNRLTDCLKAPHQFHIKSEQILSISSLILSRKLLQLIAVIDVQHQILIAFHSSEKKKTVCQIWNKFCFGTSTEPTAQDNTEEQHFSFHARLVHLLCISFDNVNQRIGSRFRNATMD